jgi:hypothetical protein
LSANPPRNGDGSQSLQVKEILPRRTWGVYLLPVSGFPVPAAELLSTRQLLTRVIQDINKDQALESEIFLQSAQVRLQDGSTRLSDHAGEWKPKLCLGVWPDRPGPTRWTREELEALAVGEEPRRMMYTILYLSGPARARESACDVMLGLGAIVRIMRTAGNDSYHAKIKEVLKPIVQQKPFSNFPNFMPLFDCKSMSGFSPDQLDKWLCGAAVYIRESPEDNGIMIASSKPLDATFERLGGRFEQQPSAQWLVSC